VTDPVPHPLVEGCGLPQAWHGQRAWRILDTRLGSGLAFLATWQAWLADAQRPRMLHYVALSTAPVTAAQLLQSAAGQPQLLPLAQQLAKQWTGLLPGFHRLTLQDGQVLLTLCVGDTRAMLREQQFVADSIYLDAGAADDAPAWDRWDTKALARCCRRGTTIVTSPLHAEQSQRLSEGGFELKALPLTGLDNPACRGEFNPHWTLKNTRRPLRAAKHPPGSCAVIGAGLAGASVAAALARRGWQVQVLDAESAPATGASGLPAGLLLPHVSGDDSPRSRLSRSGVRLMLQQARSLLQPGQDWDSTGVLEHRLDKSPGLPAAWPAAGQDWSRLASEMLAGQRWSQGMNADAPTLWHAQGAWLKPARLVQAWLAQSGVQLDGQAKVAMLQRANDQWRLLDAAGKLLASASHVVLANGHGAIRLLADLQDSQPVLDLQIECLPALQAVRGQISWALQRDHDAAALPPFPVNGLGSLIPAVPVEGGLAWFAGATYEADEATPINAAAHHHQNQQRLQALLPEAGNALADLFEADHGTAGLMAWSQTRCVTADRLPMVGPLESGENPTLWISSGMGSRGLSFSVLCAELLAARLGAEPWPIEASLARSLEAARV
jgi:tRNA 5-methylaminomethyl-2-thiouridine biosynthesis bifunctional protein